MTPEEHDELVAALRSWARTQSDTRRAAVELLITHGVWLRRAAFRRVAVHTHRSQAWVDFTAARDALHAGAFQRSSTTEHAVLELAIALGVDHYRLSMMGAANAAAITTAVTTATGTTPTPWGGTPGAASGRRVSR